MRSLNINIVVVLCLAISSIFMTGFDQAYAASSNIALLTTVTASSENTSTGQLAVKAMDGVADGYPGDYTKEWATLKEKKVNLAPVADAGPDQTVNEGDLVTLDGSGSSDPDQDPLTYLWRQDVSDPIQVTLSDPTAVDPSFTAPTGLSQHTALTFNLVVNDGKLDSAVDSVVITVPVNLAPVADAGPDQTVNEGDLVTLDGSGSSDPDQDPLTYLWQQDVSDPNQVTLSDATAVGPSFTAPTELSQQTALTFNLVVNDGQLDSAVDSVVITVQGNLAPVADAGPDQTVNEGDPVTLDGSGSSDPDQDPLTYLWQQDVSDPIQVTLSDATAVGPSFTAPAELSQQTALTFNLVVNDGQLDSAVDSVVITVLASQPQYSNIALLAEVTASSENTSTGQLAVKAVDGVADGYPGDYTKEWATLKEKSGAWIQLTWSSAYLVDRIVLYDRPNTSDQILSATLSFSDGSTHEVGPLDNTGGATEYTFSAKVITSVTMTVDQASASTNNIGLSEIEVYGESYQGNLAPVADAGEDQTVNEGDLVTLDGSGSSDPDQDPLTYLWQQDVNDAIQVTLSDATAVDPSFTAPTELSQQTALTFNLVVNDGQLDSAVDSVVITVQGNLAPVADAGEDQTVNEGDLVTLDGSGSSDPDQDPLTYLWQQDVNDAIQVTLSDPTAFGPSFTAPTELSQHTALTFNLVVNDGQLDSAVDSVVITVQGNLAPVADAGEDQTVNEGDLVTLDGSGSYDPDQDPLTYLWQQDVNDAIQVTLSDPTAFGPSFTAPTGLSQHTALTFNLVVNDGQLDSVVDSVVITVLASQPQYSNIALLATVTASSENTSTGQLAVKAVDGVADGYPGDYTKEWATLNEKSGAWIQLTWSSAYLVDRIVLYDRPNTSDQILSATLSFSDGSILWTGALDNQGGPTEYNFNSRIITSLTLSVFKVSGSTLSVGLSEIEIFGSPCIPPNINIGHPHSYFLQTSPDLYVKAGACLENPAHGVRFLVDGGQEFDDYTDPYEHTFWGLSASEHVVEVQIIDESETEIIGDNTQDQAVQVGIGNYLVATGDSITYGYGGDLNTSQDGRNTDKGFEPPLNDLLTDSLGIPHTVVNEGVGGEISAYGASEIDTVLAKHPDAQRILVQWGTNDADSVWFAVPSGLGLNPGDPGYPGSFKDNMQQIIDAINEEDGKEACLAKLPIVLGEEATGPKYDDPTYPPTGSRGDFVMQYNAVIDELRNDPFNNITVTPPDFWALFNEDVTGGNRYNFEYFDNIHPNGTGYQSMANRWFQVLTQ